MRQMVKTKAKWPFRSLSPVATEGSRERRLGDYRGLDTWLQTAV